MPKLMIEVEVECPTCRDEPTEADIVALWRSNPDLVKCQRCGKAAVKALWCRSVPNPHMVRVSDMKAI